MRILHKISFNSQSQILDQCCIRAFTRESESHFSNLRKKIIEISIHLAWYTISNISTICIWCSSCIFLVAFLRNRRLHKSGINLNVTKQTIAKWPCWMLTRLSSEGHLIGRRILRENCLINYHSPFGHSLDHLSFGFSPGSAPSGHFPSWTQKWPPTFILIQSTSTQ